MSIDFYNQHGQAFFERSAHLQLTEIWDSFLELLPTEASILDAGCGSGRDSRHFREQGHRVTAIDASEEMVRLAIEFAGLPVRQLRLQELDYDAEFDGVWCCAAALHVPAHELGDVLGRLHRALKPGGVCYLSFKLGPGGREEGERFFLDMDEQRLAAAVNEVPGVEILRTWRTVGHRPDRDDIVWVNQLSSVEGRSGSP